MKLVRQNYIKARRFHIEGIVVFIDIMFAIRGINLRG